MSSYADLAVWLSRVAVNRLANRQRGRRRLRLFLARAPRADDPPSPHDVVGSLDVRAAVAALAAAVWDRYGPAIEIQVGGRIFPTGAPVGFGLDCPAVEPADGIAGLEATLELEGDGVVQSGADFGGTIHLRNTTDEDITIANPTTGNVVETGGPTSLA